MFTTELSTLAALIRDGQLPEIRLRPTQVGPILIPLPVVASWVDSRALLSQSAPPWWHLYHDPIVFIWGDAYIVTGIDYDVATVELPDCD